MGKTFHPSNLSNKLRMEEILEAKRSLRKAMVLRKSAYSATLLSEFSKQALGFLEKMPEFIQADVVAIYYSMADEVQTVSFIENGQKRKRFYFRSFMETFSGFLCIQVRHA